MTRNHREAAIVALIDRELERAADTYTRAAHGTLAGFECEGEGRDPLGADSEWAGYGLAYLALAGLCYRAAGRPERATARCHEGIAIARDLFEATLSAPLDRACCFEFIGDFGVIGDLTVEAGYDRAITAYETAGTETDEYLSWATGPMAEAARMGPQQAARNTPHAFAWDDVHGSDPDSIAYLTRRPRFKRSRLPTVIEHVVEVGFLHPPRATTEHNNANWRCPDCGDHEVHWIAGETICLDCSVRMVET
jgi:hypothetical protein